MNHTKGPWHIANGRQIRSERDQIAMVWMMRDGEGKANAALIAAAPRLLDALKRIANKDRHRGTITLQIEDLIDIEQAISEATLKG